MGNHTRLYFRMIVSKNVNVPENDYLLVRNIFGHHFESLHHFATDLAFRAISVLEQYFDRSIVVQKIINCTSNNFSESNSWLISRVFLWSQVFLKFTLFEATPETMQVLRRQALFDRKNVFLLIGDVQN